MRRILRLDKSHIDDYTRITYKAYPSFKDYSKEGIEAYKNSIAKIMDTSKDIHFYGAFQSGVMVGVMRLFDFDMNLFGRITKTSGIGFLGVDPLYKKEKIALDMVKFYERHYKKLGIPLGILLPFRTDFYKSMGYGFGTKINQYRIKTKSIPSYKSKHKLAYIDLEKDLDKLLLVRRKMVEKTHGMALNISTEVEKILSDRYSNIVASFREDGSIDGYLSFYMENALEGQDQLNNIYINELIYTSPEALLKLLDFLKKQEDQVDLVIFNTKDDYFHYLFSDPINDTNNIIDFGNLESNSQAIGFMYKLLDIKNSLKTLDYRDYNGVDLRVRFLIADDYSLDEEEVILNLNKGVLSLGNNYDFTVKILISDFSSMFMGSINPISLARLGLLKIDKYEYLKDLDRAFYLSEKPYGNIDF